MTEIAVKPKNIANIPPKNNASGDCAISSIYWYPLTVSKATFLSNLAPIVVILFSLIFLKEKFSKFFFIAIFISMSGMTLLLGESFQFYKSQFFGDLLGVLTAIWYLSLIHI